MYKSDILNVFMILFFTGVYMGLLKMIFGFKPKGGCKKYRIGFSAQDARVYLSPGRHQAFAHGHGGFCFAGQNDPYQA